jgi:tetratricopeptide (TPR) repeat protein
LARLRGGSAAVALLVLVACAHDPGAAAGGGDELRPERSSPSSQDELPTTDGAIAVSNLEAQIEGEERLGQYRPLTVAEQAGIAERIAMHGQFLGRVADYERAEAIADDLVRAAPADPAAFLSRARARSAFHRFGEALADLGEVERLGMPGEGVESLRAAIFQATARYDEALAIRERAAEARPSIGSLTALASVHADRGEIEAAERLFTEAPRLYRDVSPFPVAWLYFQQGAMWMREGELQRARELFAEAHRRLPAYAAAQGHLAEVESALGQHPRAVELLLPLAQTSDDPDYAAQLARILAASGREEEAGPWRAVAAARYDELVARHPEAFADHASEFWLAAGGDPQRALALAQANLKLRATPRAYELVLRAALASQDRPAACTAATHTRDLPHLWPSLRDLTKRGLAACDPPS